MTAYMKAGAILSLVALAAAALFGAYHHGLSVKDAEWQAEWNARDTRDAAAALVNEADERVKEQARQQSINKAIQNGQQIIDRAVADAAVARADLGVRDAADAAARRIAVSQSSGHSCTTAASQAATRAVMVLADVLKRADQRAGDLAADADQSRGRGVTCEQTYISLGEN